MNLGDHIVSAIYFNNNVIDSEEADLFRNIKLFEAISDRCYSSGLFPTHQKEKFTIDVIFISQFLSTMSGRYFTVSSAPSDYRSLWIKIKISFAFGCVTYYMHPFSSLRVKHGNHRIVQRFNKMYGKCLLDRDLFQRIYAVQRAIDSRLWDSD